MTIFATLQRENKLTPGDVESMNCATKRRMDLKRIGYDYGRRHGWCVGTFSGGASYRSNGIDREFACGLDGPSAYFQKKKVRRCVEAKSDSELLSF